MHAMVLRTCVYAISLMWTHTHTRPRPRPHTCEDHKQLLLQHRDDGSGLRHLIWELQTHLLGNAGPEAVEGDVDVDQERDEEQGEVIVDEL